MIIFRHKVIFYVLLAIIGGGLIWFYGEHFYLATEFSKALAIVGLCALMIVIAIYFGFEQDRVDEDAVRRLKTWLKARTEQIVGTTQARVTDQSATSKDNRRVDELTRLRECLYATDGIRWPYRRPWLLLTGDASAITGLAPDLEEQSWHATEDAVFLWSGSTANDQEKLAWLKELRKMRRRRPVDAIVVVGNVASTTPSPGRSVNPQALHIVQIASRLRWSAPVYVLDNAELGSLTTTDTPLIGCELSDPMNARSVELSLNMLRERLTNLSIASMNRSNRDRYLGLMSQYLDERIKPLSTWMASLDLRQRRTINVRGVFFTSHVSRQKHDSKSSTVSLLDTPLWHHIATDSLRTGGHRIGLHPVTVISSLAIAALTLWSTGLLFSAATNAHDLLLTGESVHALNTSTDAATRLRNLLALQQRISLYEDRIQQHAPVFTRFGLNHDARTLAAVWKPYTRAARTALITPVQQNLEAQLVDLNQMQTVQLDAQVSQLAQDGHKALKTYLMMAEPARAEPAFMTPLLPRYWNTNADLSQGEKLDLSQRLLTFYADHLKQHPDWHIDARDDLVSGARQTLLAVIGVKNSEDTIYQDIIASVGRKYPDQSLASLTAGTDTRGLLRSVATVPGVYTREAWEGTIEPAIDEAAKHDGVASDWVLAEANNAKQTQPSSSPEALKAALTSRYFEDYAEHWQAFMNTLQWEPATSMPAAIGQLKALADARQSPLIALMKSLEFQGGAGAQKASLSDTLVTKAQNIFGSSKTDDPQAARPDPAGPLGPSFGPVLRLVAQNIGGDSPANNKATSYSDLSLQRYLERVTTLRLRLQQIGDSPDADAQARQVAQTLFQGKGSELADTQSYARLIAASLGVQWAGMGDALFVRPVAQALQTVLQPAQASLNEAWQQTIVSAWNRSFAGRYPFASTANDASLPELARFLRPQGGLISAFLASQLAGVLELQGDQWMPVTTGTSSLVFDPSFLSAVNTLQRIAGHMLAQGEPQYRFDFKPVPSPGITDTLLTVDGQKLHYFNQQETWQPMNWPSIDPLKTGTRIEWQTEKAGTNRTLEFDGRWAFVRMLEHARVEPVDSATYMLTWQASPLVKEIRPAAAKSASDPGYDIDTLIAQEPGKPAPGSDTHALGYIMRTDVGKGPLELLALKGFVLPSRIFMTRAPGGSSIARDNAPPPLPKAAIEAAKRAAMPLPQS